MTGAPPPDLAFGAADLTNCDREPIHVPGSVQPHGLLLVLHPETLEVLQLAGATALLGAVAAPGLRLGDLLPAAAVAELAALVPPEPDTSPIAAEIRLPDGRLLDVALHRTAAGLMLEAEPLPAAQPARASPLPVVQSMLARLQVAGGSLAFCEAAAEEVRRVTGFDRVMVYRFQPDGSGVVIAESRAAGLGAYLGLHYPATDVPRQARELYLRNWLRLIPDALYAPAPLVPPLSPLTGAPPDLSHCALRSVSPLHLEYLANMGVRASMSLSVVRGGRLWGLIACHHMAPRHLPLAIRTACTLFAQVFSLQLSAKEQAEEAAEAERLHRVQETLVQGMAGEEHMALGLARHGPALRDLVSAGGVALLVEGSFAAIGEVPEEEAVRALVAWLGETAAEDVVALDRLPELWPPARDLAGVAAGVLAVFIGREKRDCILWFRPEQVRTVTWAGDPDKPVEVTPDGARLSPRRSFAAWEETVRGRARAWSPLEIEAAQALRVALLELVLRRMDQVAQERARARERQDLLLAELDHRVKNMLANIQALVRHSSQGAAGLDTFVTDLHARLRAMAQAHSLLSLNRWEGAGLRALAGEQLKAHLGGEAGPKRAEIIGPDLRLRPKAALALSLALHELVANATRHGALSVPGGQVRLAWWIEGERLLLEWRERGGPAVSPPARRGFGALVIERSLAYEVGGRSRLDFAPEGVTCRVEMPLRQVTEAGAVMAGQGSAQPGLRGVRVLVVEDSALVAMELESALKAEGAEVAGPLARLEDAIAAVEARLPDAALLDIDLDGVPVFPVADRLAEHGVPVVFTTGYEPRLVMPPRFAAAPVLRKPFRGEEATATLLRVLAGR